VNPKITACLIIGTLIGLIVVLNYRDQRRNRVGRVQEVPMPRDPEYPSVEQHRAAELGFFRWQIRLGVVTLLFAAGAVAAAVFTWQATQGQLEVLRSEQRPWIYADVVPFGPIIRNVSGGYNVQAAFVVHNTGHLPAMFVWVAAGGMVQPSVPQVIAGQNYTCRQRDAVPYQTGTNGSTLFPGQTLTLPQGIGVDKPTWDQAIALNDSAGVAATITGCIDYQVPGDAKHHHTRFAYMVGQKIDNDPTGINLRLLPTDPTVVPLDRLVFQGWPVGSVFSAD
jgi:hypothetical protein